MAPIKIMFQQKTLFYFYSLLRLGHCSRSSGFSFSLRLWWPQCRGNWALDPKKQPEITDILNWNQVQGISDIIYHESQTLISHDMNQVLCGADQQLIYYGRKWFVWITMSPLSWFGNICIQNVMRICAAREFWLRKISRLNIVVVRVHTPDESNKQFFCWTRILSLDHTEIPLKCALILWFLSWVGADCAQLTWALTCRCHLITFTLTNQSSGPTQSLL